VEKERKTEGYSNKQGKDPFAREGKRLERGVGKGTGGNVIVNSNVIFTIVHYFNRVWDEAEISGAVA